MPDQSELDARYFIDQYRYNCPYCNRGSVAYQIEEIRDFDWSDTKKAYVYFVRCRGCGKKSMHLTYDSDLSILVGVGPAQRRVFSRDTDVDEAMFYSVPTSFHVIDERIPRQLRELISEAQGSLKSNFLTGASACARKVVYEVAVLENAEGETYGDRIRSLKAKLPQIDPSYFDTLLTIQEVTSDKVHEESYDGWKAKHLRLILATLMEILDELYVFPKVRDERRKAILGLKEEVLGQAGAGGKSHKIGTTSEPEQVSIAEEPSGAVTMEEPENGHPWRCPGCRR